MTSMTGLDEPQLLGLVVRTQPLDAELHRGLQAVEEPAVPQALEPAPDLLVAGAARLRAEVVARGEPEDETDPELHSSFLPQFGESRRVLGEHTFATLGHGLPRQGRSSRSRRELRAENLTLNDIATQLGRQQVLRLPLGPRRPLHPIQAPPRSAPPTASRNGWPSSRRSKRSTPKAELGSGPRATKRSSSPAWRSTRARAPRPTVRCRSRTLIPPWSGSSVPGSAPSSRSTKSRLRVRLPPSGPRPRRRRGPSGPTVTGDSAISQFRKGYRAVADPSIRHNKHEHGCCYVVYSCTNHPSRDHGSACGLCYRQTPFRGSSIGRALGC